MMNETRFLPAVGRVLIAAIFLLSGIGKIAAPGATVAYIASAGLPVPLLALIIAIIVEVGGGILLVLGYQTRIVTVIMAAFTLAAAFGFHNNFADQNQMINFMKNLAITGGLLQVVAFGAGSLSLDARRGRSAGSSQTRGA